MAARRPLVVYLQYTNPAGYPPLDHSSRILAKAGFEALFLGAAAHGSNRLVFQPCAGVTSWRLPSYGGGVLQPVNYVTYALWAAAICLWRRPAWLYVSDHLACPVGLLIARLTGAQIVYHEHDTPSYAGAPSRFLRAVRAARLRMARRADLCVLPQAGRLSAFVAETGRQGPTQCVWNCPLREEAEAAPARDGSRSGGPTFYFHGSLNRERLPLSVVDAAARAGADTRLAIVGYETVGSKGHIADLLRHAAALGLEERVLYAGPLPLRADMLAVAASADVGLAFMPPASDDINMAQMAGASNKPFDYLAVGQMLLVSDLPDWRSLFVEPGFALACDPYDVDDLARAMRWCVEHPDEVRAIGERGRRRIVEDWNYERRFAPVADLMIRGSPTLKNEDLRHAD